MKTHTEQNLFSELATLATDILMSCKRQHCISDQMCLSFSILIDALSSAQCPHSMKTFISELFCGQNFWSVATTVHLLLSSLAVHNLSLECLSNKHPLINQHLFIKPSGSILIKVTVFWTSKSYPFELVP